ncbi:glutathione S-transferase T3-like protein [Tanacetum coccineum]
MGGSSSQPRTEPAMSPINAFPVEDLYTPEFSESLHENTGYWQEPSPHESPVEQVATSPTKRKILTRWVAISENSEHGNARKKYGFWCEVLGYIESKTKTYGRPTYDMVVGKWKTMRPVVIRFCGVYCNVMRMAQENGAGDEDYVQRAMIHYQTETGLPFKFRHCWDVSKNSLKFQEIAFPNFNTRSEGGSKRHKSSDSSSFNIKSEDEVQEIRRPVGRDKARAAGKNRGSKTSGSSTMNDDALARLMVTEMKAQKKVERLAFMEIKRREVESHEREVAAKEYRAQQEDIRFYLQPYNHLTGDQRLAINEVRAKIKAKYNLQY